jgi:hypothetical protein
MISEVDRALAPDSILRRQEGPKILGYAFRRFLPGRDLQSGSQRNWLHALHHRIPGIHQVRPSRIQEYAEGASQSVGRQYVAQELIGEESLAAPRQSLLVKNLEAIAVGSNNVFVSALKVALGQLSFNQQVSQP